MAHSWPSLTACACLLIASLSAAAAAPPCLTNDALASFLQTAIANSRFNETWDLVYNATTRNINNVDVSVISFDDSYACPPAFANVLLSRDFPQGRISSMGPNAGMCFRMSTCVRMATNLSLVVRLACTRAHKSCVLHRSGHGHRLEVVGLCEVGGHHRESVECTPGWRVSSSDGCRDVASFESACDRYIFCNCIISTDVLINASRSRP